MTLIVVVVVLGRTSTCRSCGRCRPTPTRRTCGWSCSNISTTGRSSSSIPRTRTAAQYLVRKRETLPSNTPFFTLPAPRWDSIHQRPYRKDRLPRNCCRQLANFRIVRGICLYNALLGPVCSKLTESCFPCCGVLGFCRFWFKIQDFMGWN